MYKKGNPFNIGSLLVLCFVVVSVLGFGSALAESLSIVDLELVEKKRISRVVFEYKYRAHVRNTGGPIVNAKAVVVSSDLNTKVVDQNIDIGVVNSDEVVSSIDTFSIQQNRRFRFNPDSLAFNFSYDEAPEQNTVHRALLGPLSGALVEVFSIRNLDTPLFSTYTDTEGSFSVSGESLTDDVMFLVRITGGYDTDPNQDGIVDPDAILNKGSIHAIATKDELTTIGINVTNLSDIAWRYTEQNISLLSLNDLLYRLNQLAVKLIGIDINGDNKIDHLDLNQFLSSNAEHLTKLNFFYELMFDLNDDGASIISAYHEGDTDLLLTLLDEFFSSRLSQSYVKNPLSDDVSVKLVKLGKGSVSDEYNKIVLRVDDGAEANSGLSFYDRSSDYLTIIAQGTSDTEVVGWNGCDEVSSDNMYCSVSLLEDREIVVSFGYKEAVIVPNLVDLSRASVVLEGDSVYHVSVNHGDLELAEQVSNLVAGDFVVGDEGDGFLRKIISITKSSTYKYSLVTTAASIDEIVEQGTLSFNKTFTNDDIDPNLVVSTQNQTNRLLRTQMFSLESPETAASQVEEEGIPFSDIPGITLVRSGDPDDSEFVIQFGGADVSSTERNILSARSRTSVTEGIGGSLEGEVVLYEKDGKDIVKASGKLKLNLTVDFGASYGLFTGLEYFKLIPTVTVTEDFELFVGDEVKLPEKKKKIGSIPLKKIVTFIGPVPVYIKPQIDLYLGFDGKVTAKASTGIKLEQLIRFGVVYNDGAGVNTVGEFKPSWDFKEPVVEGSVSMRGFVRPDFLIKLYGVTGPGIPVDGYVKVKADATFDTNPDVWRNDRCFGGIDWTAWLGIDASVKWEVNPDTGVSVLDKFLREKLSERKISARILKKEWFLGTANIGGACDETKTPPYMSVTGAAIYEVVRKSLTNEIVREYVVTNDGGQQLSWSLDWIEDGVVTVDKTSGKLDVGTSEVVTVTVAQQNLPVGVYRNEIRFKNNYDFNLFSGYESGDTSRSIEIEVIQDEVASPNNFNLELFKPTIVSLEWDYPSSGTSQAILDGFTLFISEDGQSYEAIATIANPNVDNYLVGDLLTDKTYYFAIDAYSGSTRSATLYRSIYIPPIAPEGDCRAHFSGGLMNDHFISGWTSEAYVVDSYSEYVGAGLYPSNGGAFPKAVSTTFDGIAIDKGTKVTIYSGANFTGTVLYEKVGPAIINNYIWRDYSQVASVMGVWKEPLQSNYPQSVRSWSQSNMHDWSNGSLIVECGYE